MAFAVLVVVTHSLGAEPERDTEWMMFITHPNDVRNIGDEVNVTVHVFSEGERADPPNITFKIDESGREINLTRISSGLYRAQFTILQEELERDQIVQFACFINETDGTRLGRDHSAIRTPYHRAFGVDMLVQEPSDGVPIPGQDVVVMARTTYMGQPIDPDHIEFIVYHEGEGSYPTPVRVSQGIYSASFSMPSDMTKSNGISFIVDANYTDESRYYEEVRRIELYMDVFHVWAEVTNTTRRGASIEMYVTDLEGRPVGGAAVDIEASLYANGGASEHVVINDTTDASGMIAFIIEEYDRFGFWDMYVDGTITADGLVQWLDDDIILIEEPRDLGSSLIIEHQFDYPFEPGVSYELAFHVFYDRNDTVWSGQEVIVYIFDWTDAYLNQRLVTDTNGDFSVQFTAPELAAGTTKRTIRLLVKTWYGGYWHGHGEYMTVGYLVPFPRLFPYLDDQMEMDVGPMGPDMVVNITLDHADADGTNETVWVYWGPLPGSGNDWLYDEYSSDWWIWSERETLILTTPCVWNGDAYEGSITLPFHVPNRAMLHFAGVIAFTGADDWGRSATIRSDIMFEATGPPSVNILTPKEGETHSRDMLVSGRAFDDVSVVQVEVIIDDMDRRVASGTDDWSLVIDTTELEYGLHKIGARAFDGTEWSEVVEVVIMVNQPPVIEILGLDDVREVTLPLNITGTTSDDGGVVEVLIGFEFHNTTIEATGTDEWFYVLDEVEVDVEGFIFIIVRAYDAEGVDGVDMVMLRLADPPPPSVLISYPEDGVELNNDFVITGSALPGGALERVEVRIGGGSWGIANGSDDWTYRVSIWSFQHGENIIEARAYDGIEFTPTISITIIVDAIPEILERELSWGQDMVWIRGTARDDDGLEYVEMRFDDGGWFVVNGTTSWDHTVYPYELPDGDHTVEIRAFDGKFYSEVVTDEFSMDNIPILTVDNVIDKGDVISFEGNASDSGGVENVIYRLDEGEWTVFETTDEWSFQVDKSGLDPGEHTIDIKAFDGIYYSNTYSTNFTIEEVPEEEGNNLYLVIGIASVIAVVAVVALVLMRGRD
jgi:hypothetical protein